MNLKRYLAEVDFALRHGELQAHDTIKWRCHLRLEKRMSGIFVADETPYEVIESEGNLLMTAGANAVWTRLIGTGTTAFDASNAQIVVGDATTAAAAGDTDMGAAAGSTDNTGDISAATNATPIVITVPSWTTLPVVGEVYVVAGVLGNTGANGTFEVQTISATQMTLLNSVGNGAFSASAGSTVKKINKYRQLVKALATVTTNSIAFAADFVTANGNFHWQEFGVCTGGAATNKQAVPPPVLLNHKIQDLGTKTTGTWTPTITLTLA